MKLAPLMISLIFLTSTGALADKEKPAQEEKSRLGNAVQNVRAAASELIVSAMGLLGVNYQYGGKDPETGFDCSGFVSHVFSEAAGVVLPHNAYQMSLIGKRISSQELRPGDLVFYNTLKRAFSHVGIYIGNNKFIHSPSQGKTVEIADMKDHYWLKRYQGARRVTQLEQAEEMTPGTNQSIRPDIQENDLQSILH